LLPLLKQPGLEVTDLAKRVRTQVEMLASTIGRDQRPAFYHELSGDFFLVGPTKETSSSPAASMTVLSEAALGWNSVKDVTDLELLEAFIRQFNGTFYAGLAQAKLAELKKPQAGAPPPVVAMTAQPAPAVAAPGSLSRTQSAPGPNRRPSSAMEAAQAWLAVKESTDPQLLDAFLQQHGDSIYAAQAHARIADLRDDANSSKMAAIVPQRPAAPKAATPAVGVFPQTRSAPLSATQERALKPKDTFEECASCPEMVVMPAGSFTMGSPENEPGRAGNEGPQRTVSIAKAFAVGKFAVTFSDWDACLAGGGCNGYKPADQAGRRGRHPVINVSWNDAKAYLEWLSKTTGKPYRLLSEAEREYVTRAGSTTPFWFGATTSSKQANYNGTIADATSEKGEFRQRTLPVDFFAANPFGLHQVHGNVYEWTEDCWRPSYAGAPSDGSARTQAECGARTIRGGSLTDAASALRSAARSGYAPDNRSERIGFRVARSL
jgi:formylglycine-generating enzyme required for sulfatase activity